MQNIDIRAAAQDAHVKLWRIAARLGITDYALSRKLRQELSEPEKAKITEIINELSGEVE